MANTNQAKKRARQADKHRAHNRHRKSTMRTAIKHLVALIKDNKTEEAKEAFRDASSLIDRIAQTNAIDKNKAARLKSRLHARLKSLAA